MLINIHTHRFSKNSFSIFNGYTIETDFTCSYGIHPWLIKEYSIDILANLEKLVQKHNCYAVGECGLDKMKDIAWEEQVFWFEKHIELSEKYKKPLLIHCVKASQELIEIKRKFKPKQPWIFHGFAKSNLGNDLIKEGFYLSIGMKLLKDPAFQRKINLLPLDKLFLETDDKYVDIAEMYQKMAGIKNISMFELEQSIEKNFQKVFNRNLHS
jgi:TatD DNase family protein